MDVPCAFTGDHERATSPAERASTCPHTESTAMVLATEEHDRSTPVTSGAPGSRLLAHRRQFLIGPRHLPARASWRTEKVGHGLFAHIGPDLDFTALHAASASLYLFGLMIHCHKPHLSDTEILQHLAADPDPAVISERTMPLGGRWALLVVQQGRHWIINDAFGMRSVVFTNHRVAEAWYASDPLLIAETLDLLPNSEAQNYITSRLNLRPFIWFPAAATLFEEVEQLLPNHRLDGQTRKQERFFPTRSLPTRAAADVAPELGRMLGNIVGGICDRYPAALALTAGLDSRTILAASRASVDKLRFYTVSDRARRADPVDIMSDPDVAGARRLAQSLGLHHEVVHSSRAAPTGVWSTLVEHTATPNRFSDEWIAALRECDPPLQVSINGGISEAIRGRYYPITSKLAATGGDLAHLFATGPGRDFARSSLEPWFNDAVQLCRDTNYQLLDLYYWELWMGRWLSQLLLEQDLVIETVHPFNCREIIATGLAVDWKSRSAPAGSLLHKRIIELMWPECLADAPKTKSKTTLILANLRALKGWQVLRKLARRSG